MFTLHKSKHENDVAAKWILRNPTFSNGKDQRKFSRSHLPDVKGSLNGYNGLCWDTSVHLNKLKFCIQVCTTLYPLLCSTLYCISTNFKSLSIIILGNIWVKKKYKNCCYIKLQEPMHLFAKNWSLLRNVIREAVTMKRTRQFMLA